MSPAYSPSTGSYPPLLEWLLYSAGDPTERAPDDCSRGRLFDIGQERVNVAPSLVDRRTAASETSHRHREWQEPSHAEIR